MNHKTLKAIIAELHQEGGLLERKGFDVPTFWKEELEEVSHEALQLYFQEVIEFLDAQ